MKSLRPARLVLTVAACGLLGAGAYATVVVVAPGHTGGHASTARIAQTYIHLPMRFAPNRGQLDPRVRFAAQGPGYAVLLTPRGAVLSLQSPATRGRAGALVAGHSAALDIGFVGARGDSALQGLNRLPGVVNSFAGSRAGRWQTATPTFGRVQQANIWPGVGVAFHGTQRQLEYDFNVAPGADPRAIRLSFGGAQRVAVDRRGGLVLTVPGGVLRQPGPTAYQWLAGRRQPVASRWVVSGRVAQVSVGAYDRRNPLVIDPIISYSNFLGGSGKDGAEGVAVDSLGNAYIAGDTASTDLPTTPNAVQPHVATPPDVFVAKINTAGTGLVYSTYVGGSGIDLAGGIAVDRDGNAYVTGVTDSTDFPTKNAFQGALKGQANAFLFKLSPTGTSLVYSTFLGGKSLDQGSAVAVDPTGDAYVAGVTRSSDFPTLNAVQPTYGGGFADAFVTQFAPSGSSLVYSTFLGGSGDDEGGSIAVDSAGNAYVTGSTDSTNFPVQAAMQPHNGGGTDAFLTKLNSAGNTLVYSTYLGGAGTDTGSAIALDGFGQAYVAGNTTSANFPTVNALQATNQGGVDGFITKVSVDGSHPVFSTYLGGSADDRIGSIALGPDGSVYVSGNTKSTDFPTKSPIQAANAGGLDAFVAKLTQAGGALDYSTYLGGRGDESANGIAVDRFGDAYVAGETTSSDFPATNALRASFAGVSDAFITKIGASPVPPSSGVKPSQSTGTTPGLAACTDLRRFKFRFHHPRGSRVIHAVVKVNGKRVANLHGHNLKTYALTPLPQRTFVVKIKTTTNKGLHRFTKRLYHGCTKTAPKTKVKHGHGHFHA